MITKVLIENFKRFSHEEFDLDDTIVLAGPNNSGKSTLLQALSTWSLALERWQLGKGKQTADNVGGKSKAGPKIRTGQPVTRKDFTAIPLREFDLLWNDTQTALSKAELKEGQKPGEPRLIHITVHGTAGLTTDNPWSLTRGAILARPKATSSRSVQFIHRFVGCSYSTVTIGSLPSAK